MTDGMKINNNSTLQMSNFASTTQKGMIKKTLITRKRINLIFLVPIDLVTNEWNTLGLPGVSMQKEMCFPPT